MEKQKMQIYVRESWLRKFVKDTKTQIATFQVTNTIILTISIAFFIIILGMFVNCHHRNLFASKDFALPHTQIMPSPGIGRSMSKSIDLSDWITPGELWHSMLDEELMWRASMVPRVKAFPYKRTPMVAFMFLTRNVLPLAPLWELFFKGHQHLYSIYVHTSSSSSSDPIHEPHQSSLFYKRRIPSKAVIWGTSTMVDAERRLLANALLDLSNERFVLLSESCIPLFNFSTIYNYLINSKHSFVGSIDDPRSMGRGRYNKRMAPTILLSDWRKGNQWFEVQRELAIELVSDVAYYRILRDHCKPGCYMDEHYLPTLVTKIGRNMNSNRTVTWVDWSKGGSHPATFLRKDVTEGFLSRVRNQYQCVYNNVPASLCFLFARKFHPSTLEPLLRIAPILFQF